MHLFRNCFTFHSPTSYCRMSMAKSFVRSSPPRMHSLEVQSCLTWNRGIKAASFREFRVGVCHVCALILFRKFGRVPFFWWAQRPFSQLHSFITLDFSCVLASQSSFCAPFMSDSYFFAFFHGDGCGKFRFQFIAISNKKQESITCKLRRKSATQCVI